MRSTPAPRPTPGIENGQVIQTLPLDLYETPVERGHLPQNHRQAPLYFAQDPMTLAAFQGDGVVARSTPPYFSEILTLLEQIDAGRRRVSRGFTAVLERYEQGILKPCRLVPHIKSRFPDGSPSRVLFSITFQPRARGQEGFRGVDSGENWHRAFTWPLTRASLHRLGELRNAEILIATRRELDLLTARMKGLNRAALSIETQLRCYSRLPSIERPVPEIPHRMGSPRLATFRSGIIEKAWAFATRMGRTKEDLHDLRHHHNGAKPAPGILMIYSEDKEHLDGRYRWRIQPGNKCPSRLTHKLLRSLGIKGPERRLLLEYDSELRRLEARRRRFWNVLRRMKTKARAAC